MIRPMTWSPRFSRRSGFPRSLAISSIVAIGSIHCASPPPSAHPNTSIVSGWEQYGNDPGGSRYSPLDQITRDNVANLEVAWIYRTGDVWKSGRGAPTAFETTPILVDDSLITCTPYNRVIALDAETGEERWTFDPKLDPTVYYGNQFICRGVAFWSDERPEAPDKCRKRILTATNDSRLIAIDADKGLPCTDFGKGGEVDLLKGVGDLRWRGEYQVTSAPQVVRDVVVVGSAVSDNARMDAPSGVVRAYDVRSGRLRWAWDPLPPGLERPPARISEDEGSYFHGTANAWGPLSGDHERGLVFIPTGNTSPDYYGGERHGSDHYSSSLVALRVESGEVAWHFQTVHHDLWDFDVPAQPTLLTVQRDGIDVPAVVQPTKMGFLFLLHRETGEPLFPVEERPVPQSDIPGEQTAPTQPFPTAPPPLTDQTLDPRKAFGLTPFDRAECYRKLAKLRFDGIFTPPSIEGTLMFPGNAGGSNWGGVAWDKSRNLIVANVMNLAWEVALIPRERFEAERAARKGDVEFAAQEGTPYGMRRQLIMSSLGVPCTPPPWGSLAAVDIQAGEILWQVPFGTLEDILPLPLPIGRWGAPNIGGPIATAGGLVFIGAAADDYLRAIDIETGEELWKGRLPAGGQATPMTYRLSAAGKQYVVIAAGGHGRAGTKLGDSLVAFALPD